MATPVPRDPRTPDLGILIEHRRIVGLVLVFGPGLLGLGALAVGLLWGVGVLVGAGTFLTALLGAALGLRRRIGERIAALDGETPLEERPGRWLAFALFVLVGGLAATAAQGVLYVATLWSLGDPPHAWLHASGLGAAALVGAALLALFARFYAMTPTTVLPEARGLAAWLRGGFWVLALAGAALLLRARAPGFERVAANVQLGLNALVATELLGIALLARRRGRYGPANLAGLRLVACRLNPVASLFAFLTDAFGIDLRGTWALRFIQRSLLPLVVVLALVGWVTTAFTMVGTSERGVLETFGARAGSAPLEPGLHVGWPWPIQTVRRVDVDRVRTIPIGFQGDKVGTSLLWTARHATEEYSLLLGDGNDLVAVNATLHYRVGDLVDYLYESADPETGLAVLADRVLMRETVGRTLDGVLSENLSALATSIEAAIQTEADRRRLGIQVVDFTLMGLHPPVMVAEEYQAVVGAQIERDTRVLEAEAYREEALPSAEGEAVRLRRTAEGEMADQLATARGEAAAFTALEASFRVAGELFVFRRLLEARERQLAGKSFAVIDDRIEKDGGVLWSVGRQGDEGR